MTHSSNQSDWMFECDDCGLRVPVLERYRFSGVAGTEELRAMLAALGWTYEPVTGRDRCAQCNHAAAVVSNG